ncbi:MAG: SLOG family protein, partial [Oscillospiraceae bacterium]
LYAAEAVNALREMDGDLLLLCVTPHEEQATKWPPYLRERYFTMLEKCTHMTAVSLHPTPTSQLDAYKRIIDRSDMVLAVYDSATPCGDDADSAMQYAVCKGNPLLLIHPDSRNTTVHFSEI